MTASPRCHVLGCAHEAVTLLPCAPWDVTTAAGLAAAPLHPCCAKHEELISDRYAAAVGWTLLSNSSHGLDQDPEAVHTTREHLHPMDAPRTQAVYARLGRLPRTP
jgi:hypothetical protein